MSSDTPIQAIVYRGNAACNGCPEAVKKLFDSHPTRKIAVTYAGPDEQTDITADSLKNAQIFAQAGGPDLKSGWKDVKQYNDVVRDWIDAGGHYMGFCLGAYLAGSNPGYGLLPQGTVVGRESANDQAQTQSTKDTVIKVDWTYSSGSAAGTTNQTWMYYQDGASITLPTNASNVKVLGKYSVSGDVAAALAPFGKGSVAIVGTHPEAPTTWYRDAKIENPDGFSYNLGYDFIEAALGQKQINGSQIITGGNAGNQGSGGKMGNAGNMTGVSSLLLLLITLFWSFLSLH